MRMRIRYMKESLDWIIITAVGLAGLAVLLIVTSIALAVLGFSAAPVMLGLSGITAGLLAVFFAVLGLREVGRR